MNISDIKRKLFDSAAIYIGEDFVDVARTSFTLRGMQITDLQRVPVFRNIKDLSDIETKGEMDRITNKLFGDEKSKPYRIAINLRDDSLVLRRFTLARIPENELSKAIIFEAQRYVPYNMERLTYVYKSEMIKEGVQEILFLASEKENLDNLIDYFQEKKVLPSIIEPTPALLAKMLNLEHDGDKEKVYLMLHYEPTNKAVMVGIWHGRPCFFKEVDIYPTDTKFKTTELTYPTLQEVWNLIENEILGSVEYLRKETKTELSRIFISGFSHVQKEESNISKDFGIVFERLALTRFKSPNVRNKDMFLPILSLVHDMARTPYLNFARKEITYCDPWTFKPVLVKTGFVFCAILALHILLSGVNTWQQRKIDKIKREFNIFQIIRPEATRDEVLQYKGTMEKKLAFIDNALSKRIYLTEKLNQLTRDITTNSWVNTISYRNPVGERENNFLRLNCEIYPSRAKDTSQVRDVVDNMKQDKDMMKGFEAIKLVYTRKKMFRDKEINEFEIMFN